MFENGESDQGDDCSYELGLKSRKAADIECYSTLIKRVRHVNR